jgi:hypothetical protein
MRFQLDGRAGGLSAYVRASILSTLYLSVLILIWNGASAWLTSKLQGEPRYSNIPATLQSLGIEFVTLNTLGFAATALWFARSRSFAPVAKYAVPLFIALWLAIPIGLITTYVVVWLVFILRAAGKQEAWLMSYIPSVIPGIIGAQLLRFPRSSRSTLAAHTSSAAV